MNTCKHCGCKIDPSSSVSEGKRRYCLQSHKRIDLVKRAKERVSKAPIMFHV